MRISTLALLLLYLPISILSGQENLSGIRVIYENEIFSEFLFEYDNQHLTQINSSLSGETIALSLFYNDNGQLDSVSSTSNDTYSENYQLKMYYYNGQLDSIPFSYDSHSGYYKFEYDNHLLTKRSRTVDISPAPYTNHSSEFTYNNDVLQSVDYLEFFSADPEDYEGDYHDYHYNIEGQLTALHRSEPGGHGYSKCFFEYEEVLHTLISIYYNGGDEEVRKAHIIPTYNDFEHADIIDPIPTMQLLSELGLFQHVRSIKNPLTCWSMGMLNIDYVLSENQLYDEEHSHTYFYYGEVPVSVDLEQFDEVTIYPNPFHEKIEIRSNSPILEIALYDLKGRLLSIGLELDAVTNTLTPGLYILEIKTEKNKYTKLISRF